MYVNIVYEVFSFAVDGRFIDSVEQGIGPLAPPMHWRKETYSCDRMDNVVPRARTVWSIGYITLVTWLHFFFSCGTAKR